MNCKNYYGVNIFTGVGYQGVSTEQKSPGSWAKREQVSTGIQNVAPRRDTVA